MLKSKGKIVLGLVLVIVTLSLLTGCSSGGGSDSSLYTIQGTINDTKGNPVSEAKVTVGSKTTSSNSKGAWQIKDLKSGEYTAKVTLSGYAKYSDEISVNSNSTYDIKLKKIISLSITKEGNGEVLKEPNKDSYTLNEKVKITAKPSSGWDFSKWTGDIEKSENPYTITLDSNKSIKAVFEEENNSTNQAPVLDTIGDKSTNEGETLTFTVSASDPDGDEVTLSSSGLPNGASFDELTGEFTWTPTTEQIGSHDVNFTASDGELEDSETININVNINNTNPVANDDSFTMDEDTSKIFYESDVLANDTDADGDKLTVVDVTYPENGTVTENPDGFITYTPNPDYYGEEIITYTISDGNGGTDTAIATITINPVNDSPIIDNITNQSVVAGNNLIFTVSASDPDGDEVTLSSSGLPNGASFDELTGEFTWTPTTEQIGSHDVNFTASDGDLEDSKTININVNINNTNPVANDDSFTMDEDTSKIFYESDVLANDTDADGDELTVLDFTNPENGTVIENQDGSVTYTPNPDYYGEEIITYTISDGNGGTDTAIITVTVNPKDNNPIIENIYNQVVSEAEDALLFEAYEDFKNYTKSDFVLIGINGEIATLEEFIYSLQSGNLTIYDLIISSNGIMISDSIVEFSGEINGEDDSGTFSTNIKIITEKQEDGSWLISKMEVIS